MSTDNLTGIRGWLIFFVITIIFGVVRSIGTIMSEWATIIEYPSLKNAIIFETFLVIILIVATLYCLYLICTIDKNAIKITKILLVVSPLYVLIIPLFTIIAAVLTIEGLSINRTLLSECYTPEVIGSVIGATISNAIWYRYFCVSRRVKNTWGI